MEIRIRITLDEKARTISVTAATPSFEDGPQEVIANFHWGATSIYTRAQRAMHAAEVYVQGLHAMASLTSRSSIDTDHSSLMKSYMACKRIDDATESEAA